MSSHTTVADLYLERDRSEWYWRVLGLLAPSLILLGFLIFPTAFPTTADTTSSQGTLSIISVIILAVGYSLSVGLWFICKSWLFQLDVIFVPCVSACALGGINTGISLGVHPSASQNWSAAPIAAVVLSLASTTIYSALCFYTYQKIRRVRSGERQGHLNTRFGPQATTIISDEDMHRKQFERLLSQSHRPIPSNQATFRIGIPDNAIGRNNPPVQLHDTARSLSPYLDSPSSQNYDSSTIGTMAPSQTAFDYTSHSSTPPPAIPPPAAQIDAKQAALQQARERSIHNARSRERINRMASASRGPPPMIVNSAVQPIDDISAIPLNERHPLERVSHTRGASKGGHEQMYLGPVHRPASVESSTGGGYEEPGFEIVEGQEVEIDVSALRRAGTMRSPGGGGSYVTGMFGGVLVQEEIKAELEARMPRERMDSVRSSVGHD